jgi:hypothetical protein
VKPRSAKRLFLRFFLFLILGLIFWGIFQASYSDLLVSTSQRILSWLEKSERTSLRIERGVIYIIPLGPGAGGKEKADFLKQGLFAMSLHYNSVILFTLFLLIPGIHPGRRVLSLIAGLLLLFLTQVSSLLIQVGYLYADQLGQYSVAHYEPWQRTICGFLKQFFTIGKFSFPFAIWMGFMYKEIMADLSETRPKKHPHPGAAR